MKSGIGPARPAARRVRTRALLRAPARAGSDGQLSGGAQHERLWCRSAARGDLREGPAGGDRVIRRKQFAGMGLTSGRVAMLDEQPVDALARAAHAHQHPLPAQPPALQGELQLSRLQCALCVATRMWHPVATVPELHCATTVLAGRDGAFEITVVERVVLDLHREALVGRIE
jgi:hypothetical protein